MNVYTQCMYISSIYTHTQLDQKSKFDKEEFVKNKEKKLL